MALLLSFCFGCQPTEESTSSENKNPTLPEKPQMGPAAGWINGQPWQVESGRAYLRRQGYRVYLIVDLWNEFREEPCAAWAGSPLRMQLQVLPEVFRWNIGSDTFKDVPVIRFMDINQPYFRLNRVVANIGYVTIDEYTRTVRGEFRGLFTLAAIPRTEVMGAFSVPLCDEK